MAYLGGDTHIINMQVRPRPQRVRLHQRHTPPSPCKGMAVFIICLTCEIWESATSVPEESELKVKDESP